MSNIKRVVNGKFDDENSTRDIIGISPKHFEALINTLMISAQGYFAIKNIDLSEFKKMFSSMGIDFESDKQAQEQLEAELAKGKLLAELLEAINQPYEGGIYNINNLQVIYKDGKEIPLANKVLGNA